MKLATKAYAATLILLLAIFAVPAQDNRLSNDDPRNFAPTVGTGGAVGGPTGLFTIYDGKTLRKGEFTFSVAMSNFDRDPGNVDITDYPASFQIGVTNRLEFFFNANVYRGMKVNSPRNLSSFFLPNAVFGNQAAIVLAPEGAGANPYRGTAVFRPTGMPLASYPFTGSGAGNYNILAGSGPTFGFPPINALLGPPRPGGVNGAALFPGVGSVFGSILPGLALTTATITRLERPVTFTTAPSYLNDAPFVSRFWGTSSLNSFDIGVKWRFNKSTDPVGVGTVLHYTYYWDDVNSAGDFNMLQRGAGPGARRGDIGATFFADARLASWANLSGNIGYKYTTDPKQSTPSAVLLKRGDEFAWGIGADFPINKYVQPIAEFRWLKYVGSRTPNAFENHPMDGLVGLRVFPARWWGLSFAYRMHINQQDGFDNTSTNTVTTVNCLNGTTSVACAPSTVTTTSNGTPAGFLPSSDPHGYIVQFFIGGRNPRGGPVPNVPANVNSVTVSDAVISLPCPPGYRSKSGACNDSSTINVTTSATDPENDVLTYNYTVSGGRTVGTGANVQWDLSGAQPGTYTVTVGVDDGCGVCGQTKTQTVTVEACPDCVQVCECGSVSVSGPGVVNPGSPMTFTANNTSPGSVTYNWTVSAGTISSGQGTASITVDTTGLSASSNVTATVNLSGLDATCNCPSTASETGSIAANPVAKLVDEFGPLVDDDVKARIDNFFIALNNEPNAQGYIINYGTPAEIRRRRAQIMKAINRPGSGHDLSRVTFVDGPDNGTGVSTKLYIVPAGAENPTP